MKEKLTIRNFGSIKNVELELGRFNVLIGEQATGKSTVAKVLGFCRYFSNIVGDYFDEETNQMKHGIVLIDELEDNLFKWGISEYVKEDTFILYECIHYKFYIRNSISQITSFSPQTNASENSEGYHLVSEMEPISSKFKKLLNEYFELYESDRLNYEFYENNVGKLLDNPFFVPTERGLQSVFSLGKDSTSNMSDSLFRYFVSTERINSNFKGETSIPPLNVYYKNVNGRSMIRKDGESVFINLSNAASGYQSAIPIVLFLKYYTEIRGQQKTFIIEEPELNLFPSAQQKLVQYLVDKVMNYGDIIKQKNGNRIITKNNAVLLNTHSPYVLTSLNNLMYAYQLGKENPEKVEEVVEKKYWVNPDEISAYMMLPDGTCEDIFNREESLIRAEKVDGISRILNKEFDNLINIELGINKQKEASWQD